MPARHPRNARRIVRALRCGAGASGKGYVSLADLQAAVREVAPHLPQQTVALAFAQVDCDGDGRVSFQDFHTMMAARPGHAAATQPRLPERSHGHSPPVVCATGDSVAGARRW